MSRYPCVQGRKQNQQGKFLPQVAEVFPKYVQSLSHAVLPFRASATKMFRKGIG
jgi:hypothetical protein